MITGVVGFGVEGFGVEVATGMHRGVLMERHLVLQF